MQRVAQVVILDDSGNLVGHLVNIPVVDLQAVVQDFADARLVRDQCWRAVADSFQRRQTKRFGNRRHDKQIGNAVSIAPAFAALKVGKYDFSATFLRIRSLLS